MIYSDKHVAPEPTETEMETFQHTTTRTGEEIFSIHLSPTHAPVVWLDRNAAWELWAELSRFLTIDPEGPPL